MYPVPTRFNSNLSIKCNTTTLVEQQPIKLSKTLSFSLRNIWYSRNWNDKRRIHSRIQPRILRVSLERRQKALWKRGVAWGGEKRSVWMEAPSGGGCHSEVSSCSTRCQEVGWGGWGWHTNEFLPQESSSVPRTQASRHRVSEKEGRRLFSPPLILKHPCPPLMRVRFAWRQKKLAAKGQETVSRSWPRKRRNDDSLLSILTADLQEWDRERERGYNCGSNIFSVSSSNGSFSRFGFTGSLLCRALDLERGSINF